jgi:glycosidase
MAEFKVDVLPILDLEPGTTAYVNFLYFVHNTAGDKKTFLKPISFDKGLNIDFDPVKNIFSIFAEKNFSGFGKIKLEISNVLKEKINVDLLVRVIEKEKTVFKFKLTQPVKKIFVAGEFNNWNPNVHQLEDKDGDGIYEIAIPLPPGSYQYKFVVDGRWIADPENENKSPDGFGGFNSVINISGTQIGKFVPITKIKKNNALEFVLKYVGDNKNIAKIDKDNIVVKVNNFIVEETNIKWDENKNELKVLIPNLPKRFLQISVNALSVDKKSFVEYFFFEKNGEKEYFDWRDAVIYFVFTDRFLNGNTANDKPVDDPEVEKIANYYGGDFSGIIKKIKEGYFNKLGVNTIWISPVYANPDRAYRDALPPHKKFTGYHGYWPVSFEKVDERFGTMEELKELVKIAHENNIKVIFDMVVNHCHEENPVYKQHPEWFSKIVLPSGKKNIRLFDERPIDTWFDEFLPDIDYDNSPEACEYMVNNCLWWVKETNCDGFRLDAVKHVSHVFWKKLRLKLRQEIELPYEKKFYLVGETISSRDKIMEYVNPEELDGQFDFPLYWAIRDVFAFGNADFVRLEKERKKSEETYYKPYAIMSYLLGNHDFARFTAYADGDIKPGMNEKQLAWENPPQVDNPKTYDKLKLAFLFLFSQPGIPMIYYGDEIGLCGAGDPDNRRPMKFDNLTKEEKETFEFVSKILYLRNTTPALKYGTHITLYLSKDVYVYAKQYFDNCVITGLNVSDKEQKVVVDLPEYLVVKNMKFVDYLSGKTVKCKKGKVEIKLKPLSSIIIL